MASLSAALFREFDFLKLVHPLDLLKVRPGFKIDTTWVPSTCAYLKSRFTQPVLPDRKGDFTHTRPVRFGDFVHQHYTGRLDNRTQFDSRYFSRYLSCFFTTSLFSSIWVLNKAVFMISLYMQQLSFKQFFCSYSRNGTFDFFLGMGKVITGIDVGMTGMCKWERRKITLPPSMGYGNRHVGESIYGNTELCILVNPSTCRL